MMKMNVESNDYDNIFHTIVKYIKIRNLNDKKQILEEAKQLSLNLLRQKHGRNALDNLGIIPCQSYNELIKYLAGITFMTEDIQKYYDNPELALN